MLSPNSRPQRVQGGTTGGSFGGDRSCVQDVGGTLGGRLGAGVEIILEGSRLAETLPPGGSCLIDFPPGSSAIRMTISEKLWSTVKKSHPTVGNPEIRRLLLLAADVRDEVSSDPRSLERLQVRINPSQPYTTPVISELQHRSFGENQTEQALVISVADSLGGPQTLSPAVLQQLRICAQHRHLQLVSRTTNGACDSLITDRTRRNVAHSLPNGLSERVDRLLLEPGVACNGDLLAQSNPPETPHLRARALFEILSEQIDDDWNSTFRASVSFRGDEHTMSWDEGQLDEIINLFRVSSERTRGALLIYLDNFAEIHGPELYPHSERLMRILSSRPDCALPPLIQRLNADARTLWDQRDADVSNHIFYHIQFTLDRQSQLNEKRSLKLELSPAITTSDDMTRRAITVVMEGGTLKKLLDATTPHDEVITRFVEQINREVKKIFRMAPTEEDGGAQTDPGIPNDKRESGSDRSTFIRTGLRWCTTRCREIWRGFRNGDERNLWRLSNDPILEAALQQSPQGVLLDPRLANGTTLFEVTFNPFNGRAQNYSHAYITIRLAPDLFASLQQGYHEGAFDSLLRSSQALKEIISSSIPPHRHRENRSGKVMCIVRQDLPITAPYAVQEAEDGALEISCTSRLLEIVTKQSKEGYEKWLCDGLLRAIQETCHIRPDPSNLLYDEISLPRLVARIPFQARRQLEQMALSLPPAPTTELTDPENAVEDSAQLVTLTALITSYIRGELRPGTEVFRQATQRYSQASLDALFETLGLQELSLSDLALVASWIDANTRAIPGLCHADRMAYLFQVAGLTDILSRLNDGAERQHKQSPDVPFEPLYFHFRALQDSTGWRVHAGDLVEDEYIPYRRINVDMDETTLTTLVAANSLQDPKVVRILGGIRARLADILRS